MKVKTQLLGFILDQKSIEYMDGGLAVANQEQKGEKVRMITHDFDMSELEKADPLNSKSNGILRDRKMMYFVTIASDGGHLLQKMRVYKNGNVGDKITVSHGFDLKNKMFKSMKKFKQV